MPGNTAYTETSTSHGRPDNPEPVVSSVGSMHGTDITWNSVRKYIYEFDNTEEITVSIINIIVKK